MWTQTLVLHMLRTELAPVLQSRASAALTALTVAGVALVSALPFVPGTAEALGLVALPAGFFGLLALLMAGYLALSAAAKALNVRRHGSLLERPVAGPSHRVPAIQTPATPGIRPSTGDAQRLPGPPTCPARPGRCRRAGTPRT